MLRLFLNCYRSMCCVGLLFLVFTGTIQAAPQKKAQPSVPSAFSIHPKAVIKPFYKQIEWPNDLFVKEASAQKHMPLKEEMEGIGYFLQGHFKEAHYGWGDINFSNLFGGVGYRYLMHPKQSTQDWFFGVYTFYFHHDALLADRWDIGIEGGGVRSGQMTFDFNKFFHADIGKAKGQWVSDRLDEYAASLKLSFQGLSDVNVFAGVHVSWVREKDHNACDKKESVFGGVKWMLNPFAEAEFHANLDIKSWQPTARLNFRLQASGLEADATYCKNYLNKPPQRSIPPRYSQYTEQVAHTKAQETSEGNGSEGVSAERSHGTSSDQEQLRRCQKELKQCQKELRQYQAEFYQRRAKLDSMKQAWVMDGSDPELSPLTLSADSKAILLSTSESGSP